MIGKKSKADHTDSSTEEAASCAGTRTDPAAGPEASPETTAQDKETGSEIHPADTADTPQDGDLAPPDSDLETALKEAQAEAEENYDRFLRAAAELDNFRKRTAKVRIEAREDALRDVLLKIAPVIDNLNRALAQENSDGDALRQGVELIRTQMLDVLSGYGLQPIAAVGQRFDPNLHEAMMELDTSDHPPATVMEEMEKGYMLNNKVVKPARVIVSKSDQ